MLNWLRDTFSILLHFWRSARIRESVTFPKLSERVLFWHNEIFPDNLRKVVGSIRDKQHIVTEEVWIEYDHY